MLIKKGTLNLNAGEENWFIISHNDMDGIVSAAVANEYIDCIISDGEDATVYLTQDPRGIMTKEKMENNDIFNIFKAAEYPEVTFNVVVLDRAFPFNADGSIIDFPKNVRIYWGDHHQSSIDEFHKKYPVIPDNIKVFLDADNESGATIALDYLGPCIIKDNISKVDLNTCIEMYYGSHFDIFSNIGNLEGCDESFEIICSMVKFKYKELCDMTYFWDTFRWSKDDDLNETYYLSDGVKKQIPDWMTVNELAKMLGCYDKMRSAEDIFNRIVENNKDNDDVCLHYDNVLEYMMYDITDAYIDYDAELSKCIAKNLENLTVVKTDDGHNIMVSTMMPYSYASLAKESIVKIYDKIAAIGGGRHLDAVVCIREYSASIYTSYNEDTKFSSIDLAKYLEKAFDMSGGGGHKHAAGFRHSPYIEDCSPNLNSIKEKIMDALSKFKAQ